MRILPISKRQIKKAIQKGLKLVEKSPKDGRLRLKLGDLYLKNGEYEKAIRAFIQAGELCAKENLKAQAIAMYKRVLSIDPENIEAFRRMRKLYLREGLSASARRCYEKILEIKSKDQRASKVLSVIEDSKQPKPVQAGMEEDLDSLLTQFPILSDILDEDVPLHLCKCPYCRQPFWVLSTSEYYFACNCGGVSFFEDLTLRAATSTEYREIKNMNRTKTVGFA